MKIIILSLSLLFSFNIAFANVKPNSLFTDHMVLQKGVAVPIWGTADEGEQVTVTFNGQKQTTKTIDGKWMVKLSAMTYVRKGISMVISGKNTVTINDILVGEVWLCSGQSNMERQLGPRPKQQPIKDWEKERDEANYPLIRSYKVPLKYSKGKLTDANSIWKVCSPATVTEFSAIGYFFARDLYQQLNVPIGIVFSAYGGTPAEDWTSNEAFESNTQLAPVVQRFEAANRKADSLSKANNTWLRPLIKNGLYNAMIAPLLPFAIKGVAWYQGEANNGRAKDYQQVLSNLIKNWRTDFKQGDFPFLIVQIAPYKEMIPEIRESQLLVSQQVKNTALVVTTDCGNANDIHPAYKQPVGGRLALAARKLAYKENIEYSGPIYRSYQIKGNQIILKFSHATKGFLQRNTDPLKGFTIAGEDNKFKTATATIKGNKIIIFNAAIKKPIAARYGWANVPEVNLYNADGLPASPFRTDVNRL
ncbi:MAG TPA: sialate O-acetylesterase [Pedobacter sp.]|nr:sialate O-acetylesterase [Pedobacter sp.]